MNDLPSGTVTFLFTDIEGSTALWERDRASMSAAIERHLALLRAVVETHGGVLFKVVGDAVQAAFPVARNALAAAVAAQQALVAEPWTDPPGPLRVRMALHAGEAYPRDGDYLAAPLNRLARLLGASHGHQIVLTQAMQRCDTPPVVSSPTVAWRGSPSPPARTRNRPRSDKRTWRRPLAARRGGR